MDSGERGRTSQGRSIPPGVRAAEMACKGNLHKRSQTLGAEKTTDRDKAAYAAGKAAFTHDSGEPDEGYEESFGPVPESPKQLQPTRLSTMTM